MPPPLILFVDNDLDFLATRKEYLVKEGYRVIPVSSPIEAHQSMLRESIDLAILDIRLVNDYDDKDLSGLTLALEMPRTTRKIILTDHATVDAVRDFLRARGDGPPLAIDLVHKSEGVPPLLESIQKALTAPYLLPDHHQITLGMTRTSHDAIDVSLEGAVTFRAITQRPVLVDTDSSARLALTALQSDWRFNTKEIGTRLHEQIFLTHPTILGCYGSAMGHVAQSSDLHLYFAAPRDYLRVPLEFIFMNSKSAGCEEYMVLLHPMSRRVLGITGRRLPISPVFLNSLREMGQSLRILLIAANTCPPLPGVDSEIEELGNTLPSLFQLRGVRVDIEVLLSNESTYDRVHELLLRAPYHIVHYAGHGSFDRASPEKSCLHFCEKPGRPDKPKAMPATELSLLLRNSDVRFIYLSCCMGTTTGSTVQLLDDDFLGIADAIIEAGVPSALGFRRPVSDKGAIAFARTSYTSLARQGQLDIATWEARRDIALHERDDVTWISPLLILQS